MRLLRSRGLICALGVGVLAAAGLGGYAFAAGGNTISVCVKKHGGTLYKKSKCKKGDKKLTWNQAGPPGVQGPPGATAAYYSAAPSPVSNGGFTSSTTSFQTVGTPVNLPAGSYSITASVGVTASDIGAADGAISEHCQLADGSTVEEDDWNGSLDGPLTITETTLPLTIDVSSSSPSQALVRCENAANPGAGTFAVEAGPVNISAVQVSTLTNG